MIEKYSDHEFEAFELVDEDYPHASLYFYKIYIEDEGHVFGEKKRLTIRQSPAVFETRQDARMAAIFEIQLLEEGVME